MTPISTYVQFDAINQNIRVLPQLYPSIWPASGMYEISYKMTYATGLSSKEYTDIKAILPTKSVTF